jgi:hypothetical protein
MDMNCDALLQKAPNGALDINGVSAQSVHREHRNRIALADVVEQGCEARSVGRLHGATDALIDELAVEAASKGLPLCFDALVTG